MGEVNLEEKKERMGKEEENDNTNEDIQDIEEEREEKTGKGQLQDSKDKETLYEFLKYLSTPMGNKVVTNKCSIETSLETFISAECYPERSLQCRKCGVPNSSALPDNSQTTKRILIADPPPILVLQLNRVQQVVRNGLVKLEKVTHQINYPETLDISPYSSKFCTGRINAQYQLYAVIVHRGGLGRGHYIAYIKVPADGTPQSNQHSASRQDIDSLLTKYETDPALQTNYINVCVKEANDTSVIEKNTLQKSFKWFKFNDSKVTECETPPHGDDSLSDAYMLFYNEVK
ncbi:Ubiquitin carboxyl-terminal hydrolase 16 [Mizuhopecten yessoensis]|uniref:ubiquitinyl hydrolase 1 n=2 Tax=Mizuhopecten yessoensis TaxID=6573 RepID=A0A210R181_MIZYE|nr:Ubiquitin carboxyl-terminal hydrolase 16 [Mizuhopecten yessoensis]